MIDSAGHSVCLGRELKLSTLRALGVFLVRPLQYVLHVLLGVVVDFCKQRLNVGPELSDHVSSPRAVLRTMLRELERPDLNDLRVLL